VSQLGKRLFGISLGLALFAVTAEAAVRYGRPMPRGQIIRSTGKSTIAKTMRVTHGQPVWEEMGTKARHNLGCDAPDATHVALFGTSITFGTGYKAPEVLIAFLQQKLDAAEPGAWCVHNFAQPAFAGSNKLALAEEVLPELKPDVVLWESWNDHTRYTVVGKDAYNISALRTGDDGYPWLLPLPGPLNRWLFQNSRAYEYGTMALSPQAEGGEQGQWDRYMSGLLPRLIELTEGAGMELVMYMPAPLDRPFAASSDEHPLYVQRAADWADERGVESRFLADALRDWDHVELRHDPCCHLNPKGHEVVAEVMAGWLLDGG
jgi:hypothetical protein